MKLKYKKPDFLKTREKRNLESRVTQKLQRTTIIKLKTLKALEKRLIENPLKIWLAPCNF